MKLLMIFIIANTAFLCSSVRGIGAEHSPAYERVVECISLSTHADQPGQSLAMATVICDAFKVQHSDI